MATIIRNSTSESIPTDKRSVAELLRELKDETTTLVEQEVALAKAELSAKVSRLAKYSARLATGTVLGYLALLALLGAATMGLAVCLRLLGLSVAISSWLAPLIVAIVLGAIGYGLIRSGLNRIAREGIVPQRTLKTLKENKQWIEQKVA